MAKDLSLQRSLVSPCLLEGLPGPCLLEGFKVPLPTHVKKFPVKNFGFALGGSLRPEGLLMVVIILYVELSRLHGESVVMQ